ncbi:hypothetical protein JCM17846_26260 [Iodidimonas nitroreducens]|uniref:Organic solvent tolerance-like N-terminal domain-containing protein n=1 Tax=Iodidimonas nitroreducens TaxID=1236968 RepID=A0A5A7NB40_9PROT|nr:LptA/OstA family protein [Iodidimonas nitroreducens]GER04944.1 hypothetical protein JCM17846_26260 [Iodidimonas nitroreducens]
MNHWPSLALWAPIGRGMRAPALRLAPALSLVLCFTLFFTLASGAGSAAMAQGLSALKDHDIDQPIEWSADRSEILGREDVALLIGNVKVDQGSLNLTSDRMHVFFKSIDGQNTPEMERLDVTGNVKITSPSEVATAEWGVYGYPQSHHHFGRWRGFAAGGNPAGGRAASDRSGIGGDQA